MNFQLVLKPTEAVTDVEIGGRQRSWEKLGWKK